MGRLLLLRLMSEVFWLRGSKGSEHIGRLVKDVAAKK